MKDMKCIFVRGYDFPIGGASQNRLLGICKAMLYSGVDCEVLVFGPSRNSIEVNSTPDLMYDGIRIRHCALRRSNNNRRLKLIGSIYGYVAMICLLYSIHRKEEINYIFFNSTSIMNILPVYLLSRLLGARLGRDFNEYPARIIRDGRTHIMLYPDEIFTYKLYDVAFVMTQSLMRYYRAHLKCNCMMLFLPMTVDMDRFNSIDRIQSEKYIISYCGDLSQAKDGVIDLIEAYAIASRYMSNSLLQLIGINPNDVYMSQLIELVSKLNISSHVRFTGFVHRDVVPMMLQNSALLVLARPDNIQARGGFPTKIGEYLATGNPVVVTSVGEIPCYLEDESTAFLTKPGADSFADAMLRAYNNPAKAKLVGAAGRSVAEKYFSHRSQGKLIADFIQVKDPI